MSLPDPEVSLKQASIRNVKAARLPMLTSALRLKAGDTDTRNKK